MWNVFVTNQLPGNGLDRLRQRCNVEVFAEDRNMTKEELIKAVQGQDALITLLSDPIDREVLTVAASLKGIANYAVGFNNIDIPTATERGILVTNTPGVLTETSADLAWALLMSTARRIVEGDKFTRQGKFHGWAPQMMLGMDIFGKTLGIIGAGRIGQAVAKRASGFNMRVLYHNRNRLDPQKEKACNMEYVSLDQILRESDFLSLHCPLTPETKHLIGSEQIELMKPTAILLNTARGPVVDETALVKALQERRLFGAGLDVYEHEPQLTAGLAELPNVVLAPHVASASLETRSKMTDMVVDNILAILNGQKPPHLVNTEAWQA